MGKIRFIIALWSAKLTRTALKLMRRNASYFPGKVALVICPDFLGRAHKPGRIIAVTGTNGKTTVCNLLCDFFERRGVGVLNNRYGSNIDAGIASALAAGSGLFGKCAYDLAVLEVDERSSRKIYKYITPEILAVTNLFRDSIPRNAHPQFIAGIISESVSPDTKLVLNGDDLIASGLAPENDRVYFGLAELESDTQVCHNLINDMQICPVCRGELLYDYLKYHHIGQVHCADCDFKSPERDYVARDIDIEKMTMNVIDRGDAQSYALLNDSVFNIYNEVTAIAVLREFGFGHDEIKEGLAPLRIVESRYNEKTGGGVTAIAQMAKDLNALACSRVFDFVSGRPGKKELVLVMHNLIDAKKSSENICWMYDCDFELLADEDITRIVIAGPRANDYRLRLALAGVPEEKIRYTERELDAPPLLELCQGESVYIFYGTDAIGLAGKLQDKIVKLAAEVNG